MGISQLPTFDNFDFGGTVTTLSSIVEAGNNVTVSDIHLPSTMTDPIKHVYVDVSIGYFFNTSALQNYVTGAFNITANYGGATTCISLPANSFYCEAGFQYYPFPGRRIYGTVDVRNRFDWGQTTSIVMVGPVAHHDFINMFDLQAIAKVVLG
jgi:hypothetical protein